MPNGVGRTADFHNASEQVREPRFETMQRAAQETYRRTSVLDSLQPTGNGLGAPDKNRLIMGIPKSAIGQSESNFDKSLWLRNERPPSLYKTFQ